MLNCLIIDDEPLALQLLEDFVNKTPYLKLAGKFEEPLQALSVLESQKIDLLFLDIKMPDISGIDFYRSLVNKPEVIFTTAYSEYAIDGFELKAMDYLVKPISFEKFITACNRVKEFIEIKNQKDKAKEFFFINVSHKLHKIFYDDILYLEGYKDYTKVHLISSNNPLLILHNLKYFEDLLDKKQFIRIHRSYMVSLRKINTASRKSVTINNNSLPVSDNYRDSFFSLIEQH
ncbi:LytR/AlgR family response regulator transcription factor [Terrimonas pollutisoli]|uniref:LytR/AlgR family response regulator transcription factor n=1 Tax=Terrimonas pollutisoli TaxID=3034147 RepID=UPI0023ECEB52|nr:LytTR family DNA-binding domain-containing protein [Terrimonas sp. H1YJ31]